MAPPKAWWRRAAGVAKDAQSLCLTRIVTGRRRHRGGPEIEAAIIRATSHDDRSMDYKSAGRVFAWARAAPSSFLGPVMWSLSRRASRTRSWVVALKSLLLAHGLLLCSDDAPPPDRLGRLHFDLSDFSDRSSPSGFSAFVRAYFRFLDQRSVFSIRTPNKHDSGQEEDETNSAADADLEELKRLQTLLNLLMQIRPYADGMEVSLILEAMDCVVIEIFDVYSNICDGISRFLIGVRGSSVRSLESRKRRGEIGMRMLRRAAEQSLQLSSYFDLCRTLRLLNTADLPPVQSIPDEDMSALERLLLGVSPEEEKEGGEAEEDAEAEEGRSGTVITQRWVVFDDSERWANSGKVSSPPPISWALAVNAGASAALMGDLIELI
ncbi:putative clathrin assembly protein At1g25240 [Zingiber officinale]|uniref:ENTH domain-containing protein n=1 Tax=Zingiber officinale TaxID=94328 RepID=A0A8J5GPK4_ZINOF|nr:putative clathrin assembly protein At1g25240 [Zingiber officinale]KAG6509072.1 hypothetical protein ZIOFF_034463 [Zingiber officinale]